MSEVIANTKVSIFWYERSKVKLNILDIVQYLLYIQIHVYFKYKGCISDRQMGIRVLDTAFKLMCIREFSLIDLSIFF